MCGASRTSTSRPRRGTRRRASPSPAWPAWSTPARPSRSRSNDARRTSFHEGLRRPAFGHSFHKGPVGAARPRRRQPRRHRPGCRGGPRAPRRRAITSTPSTAAALAWAPRASWFQVAADAGDMAGALALGVGRRRGSVVLVPLAVLVLASAATVVLGPWSIVARFPRSWVEGSGVRGRTGFHGPRGFRFEVGFGFSWQVPDFHATGSGRWKARVTRPKPDRLTMQTAGQVVSARGY